jgi:hypothetical protein
MNLNLSHLEETKTTYFEHFWHGLEASVHLLLCAITCVIDAIFNVQKLDLETKRKIAVYNMYIDLTRRWTALEMKNSQERKTQKLEKTIFEEQLIIDKEKYKASSSIRINYIIQAKEYIVCSISSAVHSFFPQILIDNAARGLIRIYLKMQYKG